MSLKEMATCILHTIYLPFQEPNFANHIQNISPHGSIKDQTPFEAWGGRKLKFAHFKIFGSCAWTHVPYEKKKKLDPRSTTCIFVVYPYDVKGYRLLHPSSNRLIIEHNFQPEETPLHAPLEPHVDTFVQLPTPYISDDESTHLDHGLDLSSKCDLEDGEYCNDENVDVKPPQIPKWAQTTL
jgi:hypothetical protein